ncbi:hypothetical protein QBC43DRAFT_206255, partial [Cladorrhinum sp. PSN259]
GPLPMQGTPQDRFRREVLGFNHYDPRHPVPEGNNGGRMTTGSDPRIGHDFYRGSFQGCNASVPPQPAMASMGTPQLHTIPCQRRHFNPEWNEIVTPDGKFACKVILPNNVIVSDGRVYDSPLIAKQQAAMRALPVVKSWPNGHHLPGTRVSGGSRVATGFTRRSRAPELHRVVRHNVHALKQKDEDVKKAGAETNRNHGSTNESTGQISGNRRRALTREQADFFEKMCDTLGMKLPDPSKDSEEVQRAFLDGLALGSRLRQNRSSRSRSPRARRASPGRGHERVRSPARVRLTPPPHYDRWRGRPHTDRWRPDEDSLSPRPKVRESTKEEEEQEQDVKMEIKMDIDTSKRALSQP